MVPVFTKYFHKPTDRVEAMKTNHLLQKLNQYLYFLLLEKIKQIYINTYGLMNSLICGMSEISNRLLKFWLDKAFTH